MAVKIRLRRTGRKKQPTYRFVVCDSKAPRDGAFIEILGATLGQAFLESALDDRAQGVRKQAAIALNPPEREDQDTAERNATKDGAPIGGAWSEAFTVIGPPMLACAAVRLVPNQT